MKKLAQYRIFQHEDDLLAFVERLELNDIPYETAKYASGLDHTYLGAGAGVEYVLRIPQERFEQANMILEREAEADFWKLPPEYHLFDFSDEELKEIILNPADWYRKDVVYAGKILDRRGVSYSISEVRESIRQKSEEANKSRRANWGLLLISYLMLPASMFIGYWPASFSVFSGIFLIFWKRTDDHGNTYPVFDKVSRMHGFALITLGTVIFLIFWVLILTVGLPFWN
ncbi:MAG: hypothetical protein MRZ79_19470 [Bacteroidia bacterium]|nr:hypothetical protein [Bacteroidia bacterium]